MYFMIRLAKTRTQYNCVVSVVDKWTKKVHRLCPYLDTINRQVLDFDFEKLCSVSLSRINVYACLVCGKYFQGNVYYFALETNNSACTNILFLCFSWTRSNRRRSTVAVYHRFVYHRWSLQVAAPTLTPILTASLRVTTFFWTYKPWSSTVCPITTK